MLIWTKTTSAAIGVLAIFVLLLGVAVSEGDLTTTLSEELIPTLASPDSTEIQTLTVSELPFANCVLDPCSSEASTNGQAIPAGHRASYAVALHNYMVQYGTRYKGDAQQVFDSATIPDYRSRCQYYLPSTPTFQELENMDAEGALNKIYFSLLVHSAHAYFIRHQYVNSSGKCSDIILDEKNYERNLAEKSLTLARKLKSVACSIRFGISALGYNLADRDAISIQRLSNLTECSKRALRDCQVVHSTVVLFDAIANYGTSQS